MQVVGMSVLHPDDARWLAMASEVGTNIFHHPAWMHLLADCYGYRPFVLAVGGEDICAGLPVMEVHSPLTGRRWVSLPFSDHCTPLYRDAPSLDRPVQGLTELCSARDVPPFESRWQFLAHPAFHPSSHYVLHTLPLDKSGEALASSLPRIRRQNIRHAMEGGVRIEWGNRREHLKSFYQLHLESRHRQGVPAQPWQYFEMLAASLLEQGLGFVLLAWLGQECVAASVFLHWQRTLTDKYAASSREALEVRPNDLILWEAISWASQNGCSVLDMGRADLDNEGLRRFKRGWGCAETPLTYHTLSQRGDGKRLMNWTGLIQAVVRHSPVWVCKTAGELLYRHFA